MKDPKYVFLKEYVDFEVTPVTSQDEQDESVKLEIDIKKYEIAKPKRIVIRATISHDTD